MYTSTPKQQISGTLVEMPSFEILRYVTDWYESPETKDGEVTDC
jgi:hypothetical protein